MTWSPSLSLNFYNNIYILVDIDFFFQDLPWHYFWEEKAHNYNNIIISWIHSHLISVEQHSHLPSGGAAVIPRRGGVGGPDVLSVAEPQTHKLIDLEGL